MNCCELGGACGVPRHRPAPAQQSSTTLVVRQVRTAQRRPARGQQARLSCAAVRSEVMRGLAAVSSRNTVSSPARRSLRQPPIHVGKMLPVLRASPTSSMAAEAPYWKRWINMCAELPASTTWIGRRHKSSGRHHHCRLSAQAAASDYNPQFCSTPSNLASSSAS